MDPVRALTAAGFAEIQKDKLEEEITVYPSRSWAAGVLGHPCDRFLVWRWNRHQEQSRYDVNLQSIFNVGKDCQPIILRRLGDLGFEIVETDRPTEYRLPGGGRLAGKLDGKIRGFRGERIRPDVVLEAKTMEAHAWRRIETADDIRKASSPWVRGYYAQGQVYCLLENLEAGVFVIYNKSTGLLKLVPFDLDLDFAEGILRRVERLNPMVERREDPPPISFDRMTCGRCGFLGLCYPPRSFGEGAAVLDDQGLLEDLDERERLKADHDRYDDLHENIKTFLKRAGVKDAIAGDFTISAHERPVKAYAVTARTDVIYDIRRIG